MRETNVIVEAVKKADENKARETSEDRARARVKHQGVVTEDSRYKSVQLDEAALYENRVISGLQHDPRGEPYRQLRTRVLKTLTKQNWQTLAVTTAEDGAGSTLTAVNLAISLARDVNHTVTLIDLDLRNPSVHKALGFDPEMGLVDYLTGHASLDEVLLVPQFPRLRLLPGRPADNYSSELLASPRMNELVTDLLADAPSPILIFDLSSLLHTDDAISFAPTVDATLVVIEEGGTTEEEVKEALQLLHDVNVIGTVLNKASG